MGMQLGVAVEQRAEQGPARALDLRDEHHRLRDRHERVATRGEDPVGLVPVDQRQRWDGGGTHAGVIVSDVKIAKHIVQLLLADVPAGGPVLLRDADGARAAATLDLVAAQAGVATTVTILPAPLSALGRHAVPAEVLERHHADLWCADPRPSADDVLVVAGADVEHLAAACGAGPGALLRADDAMTPAGMAALVLAAIRAQRP